jgi:hypothetical protein
LLEYRTAISNKQKLKEQNMKRRSLNSSSLPPPPVPLAAKKAPAGRVNLNSTVTLARSESRKRLGSSEVASGPPWLPETRPRYHEDTLVAIQALIFTLNIDKQ